MPNSNLNEIVDERIIDLLGIGQLFDIDAGEYFTLLGERIQRSAFGSDKLSPEDLALLSNEKKRVRGERGSLKIVRKKITAESFRKKSSVENIDKINLGNQKVLVGDKTSNIGESLEILSKNLLGGPLENSIVSIATAVNSILDTLKQQKKIADDQSAYNRRKKEQERRAGAEAKLEKRFEGLKKSIEKVLSPVKSILDKIIDFFLTMVVGRIIFRLIEWLGDKNNREKVQSLIRFFKDHWSKLLSLYIIFGTSFGKFARGLVSLIVKGSVRLAAATAGLLAKAGVKKAAGVAGFLGGKKGKLLAAGLETAAVVGGTMALTKGLENFGGIGGQQKPQEMGSLPESPEKPEPPEKPQPTEKTKPEPPGSTQRYSGGGQVKSTSVPAFSGGGLNIFKMIGDMGTGGPLMGPLRLILENVLQSNKSPKASPKPSSNSGKVKRVPAMVSDGEFIMSPGAVAKYGVGTMESMNAAGGGTNKPKIMTGTTYAAGGGFIGKAAHHLKQDEALSSLSKGSNDFIKPGGKSVTSGKPWSSLTSKTPVHSYVDSVGQPTIGWGSTYYDSILNGKKPVKMGDSITKEKADNILNTNILNLSNTYSKKIPTWSKMTDDQKAGVLLVGYNAPNGPIGSYPKLTNSLKIGDMASAATNVQRGGPSASRIAAERKLLLSGPKDLSKSPAPKPTGTNQPTTKDKPKKPNILQQVTSNVRNIFSNPFSKDEPKRNKGVKAYSSGGLVTEDTGIEIKGAGLDTQAALLREGEVVLVPGAVQELGLQNLMSLNKEHGGTNKPKTVNNFQFASGEKIQNSSPNPILSLGNTGNYGNLSYASGNVARNFIPPVAKPESPKVTVISKPNISAESSVIPSSQPYTPEEPKARRMAAPSLSSTEKPKPIDLKGTQGFKIGKGYPTTYKGRDAFIVKNGVKKGTKYGDYIPEEKLVIGNRVYYAQQKGNDIIYVSNYAKGIAGQINKFGAANESYKGRGGKLVGGSGLKETDKKNLPKTRIMTDDKGKPFVGHLTFLNGVPFYDRPKQREKGLMENITNFFDPKGAKGREETLNARSIRMTSITDLEDFRKRGMKEENIKKQMGPRYKVAVNDLKARDKRIAEQKAKVIPMNDWRKGGKPKVSNLGKDYKSQELQLTAKANAARISSTKPKPKNIKPPTSGSNVKVIRTKQTNVRGGGAGSGSNRPQNTVPRFKPTSRGASTKSQLMGISR